MNLPRTAVALGTVVTAALASACGESDPPPVLAVVKSARLYRLGCTDALHSDVRYTDGSISVSEGVGNHYSWVKRHDAVVAIARGARDAIELFTERSERRSRAITVRVPWIGPPSIRSQGEKPELYSPAVYIRSTPEDWGYPVPPVRDVPPPAPPNGVSYAICDGDAPREVTLHVDDGGGQVTLETCPWADAIRATGAEVVSNKYGTVTMRVSPELIGTVSLRVPLVLENHAGTRSCEVRLAPLRPTAPP